MHRTAKWTVVLVAMLTAVGAMAAGRSEAADRALAGEAGVPFGGRAPFRKLIRESLGKLRGLKEDLGLTQEQKVQIGQILKAHRDEIVEAVQDVYAKRKALMKEVRSEGYSERAIRRAARDLSDAIGDACVLRAKVRKEVRALLTEEQRRKADGVLKDIQDSVDDVINGLG